MRRSLSKLTRLAILPLVALLFSFESHLLGNSLSKAVQEGMDPDDYLDQLGAEETRQFFQGDLRTTNLENFSNGITTTSIGSTDTSPRAVVLQTDGRILVVGRGKDLNDDDIAILRFYPDGSLDTSFSTSGKKLVSFGAAQDLGHAVTLQSDGKSVIAGRTDAGFTSQFQFAIVRLNIDGSFDTSFNTTGKAGHSFSNVPNAIARSVLIDFSGNIVAGGYARTGSAAPYAAAVLRLTTSGALDTAFKTTGKLTHSIGTGENAILAMANQTDGKIISVGPFDAYYSDVILSDRPVGYWRFGETSGAVATDFSAYGNNGTYVGSPNLGTTGALTGDADKAVGLSGTGQRIDVASTVLNPVTADFTISVWIYPTDLSSYMTIVDSATRQISLWIGLGYFGVGGGQGGLTYSPAFTTNAWQHLAMRRKVGEIAVYRNGVSCATASGYSNAISAENWQIGGNPSGGGYNFYGMMDDFALYNYALSPERIQAHYNAGINAHNFKFGAARYNTDGTLDTAFNVKGFLNAAFGTGAEPVYAVGVDTIGRAILTGATTNATLDYAIVRLNTNGTIDTTFKTTGLITTTIGTAADAANALMNATDGKLIAVGYTNNGTDNDFVVVKYKTDGVLDTSFRTNGKGITAVGSGEDTAQAVASLGDDNFVVAGRTINGSVFNVAVARYNTNGTLAKSGALDLSFGTVGSISHSFGTAYTYANAGIYQTDGKYIGLGFTLNTVVPFMGYGVHRIHRNGTLDTTFNTTGKVELTFSLGTGNVGLYPAFQTDAKLVIGGRINGIHALVKLTTDGVFDTTFSTDGWLTQAIDTALGHPSDVIYGVAIQTDGNIVGGGISWFSYGIARFLTNGVLDTSFMTVGRKRNLIDSNDSISGNSLIDTTGRIWGAGSATISGLSYFSVIRYRTDGSMDTSFFTNGRSYHSYPSTTSQTLTACYFLPNQQLLCNGYGNYSGAGYDPFVLRYNSDGKLDTSFRTSGISRFSPATSHEYSSEAILAPNGKLTTFLSTGYGIRWATDGTLDSTFGTDGLTTAIMTVSGAYSPYLFGQRLMSDGRLMTLSQESNGVSRYIRLWP